MVEFKEYSNQFEYRTGKYLQGGFRSLAQNLIQEKGRFEPEFGHSDLTRFVSCMLRVLPTAQDEFTNFGVVVPPGAENPTVLFVTHKIIGEVAPIIKIKAKNPGDLERILKKYSWEDSATLTTDENGTKTDRKISGEEMREFCAEAFSLYEQSVTS
jgi:hypothetical protein